MTLLPVAIVVLPFAAAAILAPIESWRIGARINAAVSTIVFILTCGLPWSVGNNPPFRLGVPEAHFALLISFIAMTTGWFNLRHIAAALTAQAIDRQRTRIYHLASQVMLGAMLLAVLADDMALTWIGAAIAVGAAAALTGVARAPIAFDAGWRLLVMCGVGLMLALFGAVMLRMAPPDGFVTNLALAFLLLGYGALAGVPPLQGWLAPAASRAMAPAAILVTGVMTILPFLVMLRLRGIAPEGVLITLGLVSVLLCALNAPRRGVRSGIARAGMAQLGLSVFAIGLGHAGAFAGLLSLTMLGLLRAATLQCEDATPTRLMAWTRTACVLLLAALPPFTMLLVAAATVAVSPWLLLPLGLGVALTSRTLLMLTASHGTPAAEASLSDIMRLAPIWLQMALAVVLGIAMPAPVIAWFHAVAGASG